MQILHPLHYANQGGQRARQLEAGSIDVAAAYGWAQIHPATGDAKHQPTLTAPRRFVGTKTDNVCVTLTQPVHSVGAGRGDLERAFRGGQAPNIGLILKREL